MDNFLKEILQKIDMGKKLSDRELRDWVIRYGKEVDRTEGENRRWTRTIKTYLELENRYFCVEWEEGLTEYQEDSFYTQPYEVEKHSYEKTIIVTEWYKKTKELIKGE